jgi:ribosomal protein S18 acetylase RimI-like enzyme
MAEYGDRLRTRYADPADVPAVAALIEAAYRGPDAQQGWTTESHLLTGPRTSEAAIAALLADTADSRFLLAELDGRPVACALVQRAGDGAYFGMFAVDPHHQAGGIGRSVLHACEDAARAEWGATTMSMTVISLREELIAWYERRGYARTGARKPFPFHEAAGALRDDFDFVELRKPL